MLQKDEPKESASLLIVFAIVNIGSMMGAVLQGVTKDVLTRTEVTTFELAFLRSFFNIISSAMLVIHFGLPFFSGIPSGLKSTLAIRSICGTITFLCFTAAIQFIPISVFFIITGSSIFTTALLTCIFLQDRITAFEVVAMVCSVGGIMMIGISKQAPDDTPATIYSEKHNYTLGLLIATLATIGGSIIGVTTRMLKEINFAVIQFVYSLTSSILMGICVLIIKSVSETQRGLFLYS